MRRPSGYACSVPGRPHVLLVAGRGEVLRNFFYSQTLERLSQDAKITVLSVVTGDQFVAPFVDFVDDIVPLRPHPQPRIADWLRTLTSNAHDRWQWSAVGQNNWALRDMRAREQGRRGRRMAMKAAVSLLAHPPILRGLTRFEQSLAYHQRTTNEFDQLIDRLQPDLVFNGSHIHGMDAELPIRVAHQRGIPTAGFIFSWDNLTSRTRIFAPYDHYLVWTEGIRKQLLGIYPEVAEHRVTAIGTPQFDYHFDPRFQLSREELCAHLGIDPNRPFVLYTTGVDNHFYDEHLHVRRVATILDELKLDPAPQLVVRTYTKGTSEAMLALADEGLPSTVFPPVLWDPQWHTPLPRDLTIYSSLLAHTALGINAASTVSLELMIFDKPIVNLRFDPPEVNLHWHHGYERHILFDHYRPVAESGATMVAGTPEDLKAMIRRGLEDPAADRERRSRFLSDFFGELLDGKAGIRAAESLLRIATGPK